MGIKTEKKINKLIIGTDQKNIQPIATINEKSNQNTKWLHNIVRYTEYLTIVR